MVLPTVVIVDWVCGVGTSFVRSKWPWGSGVVPVCCFVVWIWWDSLIPLLEGVEALWAS